MDREVERAYSRTFKALKAGGLLLESDPRLPCVTQIIVGRRLRSSWWADPRTTLIYRVLQRLHKNSDVLAAKLVDGKVTLIHRKLWPAILRVATCREPWQREGLSRTAKSLLDKVTKQGMLETNRLPRYAENSQLIAQAAGELERRLLVYGEGFHTNSGAHAKRLLTWGRWARRMGLAPIAMTSEQAKTRLEDALNSLAGSADAKKAPAVA